MRPTDDVEFWSSLKRNFNGLGNLEAKTKVSNWNECYLFIGDFTKYTISGVTLSSKELGPVFRKSPDNYSAGPQLYFKIRIYKTLA